MLFSNKIQKVAFAVFFIGILLSIIYTILVLKGVSMPEQLKKWVVITGGLLVYLSALVAPFTQEKEETESIRTYRNKLVVRITAIYFCLLLCCYAIRIILQVNDVDNVQFLNEIIGPKSILLLEIVYFVLLKYRPKG